MMKLEKRVAGAQVQVAGQGGEERRTRGRHADGRTGQRGETRRWQGQGKGRKQHDRAG